MQRDISTEDHDVFRCELRRFAAVEIAPRVEPWRLDGGTDRGTCQRRAEAGGLEANVPEADGGSGQTSMAGAGPGQPTRPSSFSTRTERVPRRRPDPVGGGMREPGEFE